MHVEINGYNFIIIEFYSSNWHNNTQSLGTREFLDVLPNNLSGKDLKTQAEFLNQRVQNTISQKCKEAIDPTIYTEFLSRLGNANHILTGGTVT